MLILESIDKLNRRKIVKLRKRKVNLHLPYKLYLKLELIE